MTRSVLKLPFPPSVNGLYDGGMKTSHRFTSDAYKAWMIEAGYQLNLQKTFAHKHKVEVNYYFARPDNRRRDVGKYEKAVSDLLVKHGVIKNDCLIERMTLQWSYTGQGVTVVIEDTE